MKSMCQPAIAPNQMKKFRRGDKIHFHGKDSKFDGFFLCYVDKLPLNFGGGLNQLVPKGETRCNVQQRGTGIILIKPEPKEKNRGWKS